MYSSLTNISNYFTPLNTIVLTRLVDYTLRPQCLATVRFTLLRHSVSESHHLRLTLRALQTYSEAYAEHQHCCLCSRQQCL